MNERIQWRDVPKMGAALTLSLLILTVSMIVATAWYPWFMSLVLVPAFLCGTWARVTWNDARENRDLRLFLARLGDEPAEFWGYVAMHLHTTERVIGDDDE